MAIGVRPSHPDRAVITATIDDSLHFSEEERERIIASYPAHERDARTKGIPALGSGKIFPISEDDILVQDFDVPDYWPQIVGIDFGWDHPFAAARCAWDRDNDVWYVTANYAQSEQTPIIHAASIKPWGKWLPIAWPADGSQTEKGTGRALREQYVAQDLNMLSEHATFEEGSVSVDAGIAEMLDRMKTGRWKVFNSCTFWLSEFRLYHRKDGKVVKLKDDCLSASRYALMMRRFAETEPNDRLWKPRPLRGIV